MRALVSRPPEGGIEFRDVPTAPMVPGGARVAVLECGICGTDLDIVRGRYGRAPPSDPFLVLGHENLGTVTELDAAGAGVAVGDLVVATVRRGCGACAFCAAGRSDFCSTGRYTERGIWGAHGYLAEEYVERTSELVPLPAPLRLFGVLVEPMSVVEKAIEQGAAVLARLAAPSGADGPGRALVAGTGAIGMLASLLLRFRGWEVAAVDRHGSDTVATGLLAAVGARHADAATGPAVLGPERFDLIVEATGSAELDAELLDVLATNGAIVLTGIPDAASPAPSSLGPRFRRLVLGNQALVGSVNANRTHFAEAVDDLGRIEARWPGLTERIVGERRSWEEAAELVAHRAPGAIKSVLVVGGPASATRDR